MTREGLYMPGAVFDVSYFNISEVLVSTADSTTRALRLRRASFMPGSHDIEIILPNETTFGPWPDDLFEAELHTKQWVKERTATKAGRNAVLQTRKQELAQVKAFAALIPEATGVYSLIDRRGRHVGYHLGISSKTIYLFGKGWFKDALIHPGGQQWAPGVPFGRPTASSQEAAE